MLIIGLPPSDLPIAVPVKVACFLRNGGLAAKEHALGADHSGTSVMAEGRENVEDERVVAVLRRRCMKTGPAPKAAIRVLVALLSEDLLAELSSLLLIVR